MITESDRFLVFLTGLQSLTCHVTGDRSHPRWLHGRGRSARDPWHGSWHENPENHEARAARVITTDTKVAGDRPWEEPGRPFKAAARVRIPLGAPPSPGLMAS
jgi:hypothetical protein